MDGISLWFEPSNQREGFRWSASYQGKMVGLCNQQLCPFCNLEEREKLKNFKGGNLKVVLAPHRRPSFWEDRQFYIGHLVSVPSQEMVVIDEGLEVDFSRSNAILCTSEKGGILIDPGCAGLNRETLFLKRLVADQKSIATIVSHGHLDHWNHLAEIDNPVFMSRLVFRLASRHATIEGDNRLINILRQAKMVIPGESILIEEDIPIRIDTFPLPHSIPETIGMVVKGEKARMVYLGDFKFNGMKVRQKAETIALLSEIAKEKVDFLALNIINAHLAGFTPLETIVIDSITNILMEAKGRVIISCFSTNLERIQKIIEIAQLLKRPIGFYGAGMNNAAELLEFKATGIAADCENSVLFVTGCQAEEYSVLWRILKNQNPPFELQPDRDTLIFSSRCIPGNENNLFELITGFQARVEKIIINKGETKQIGLDNSKIKERSVHVSGHESKAGLQLAIEVLKPKKVFAWPQASPQIEAFREIAKRFNVEIFSEKERIIEI
ncbi:MAG: MBL fold metallo-hydrolase [Candidatus Nealsonbacteria bacterium]